LCEAFLLNRLAKQFSYSRKEKLKSRKRLEELFRSGKSFTVFPIKIFYLDVEEQDNPVKAGVGVSGRNFKKSVQRNRIKRLLKEVYRTEKIPLYTCAEKNKKYLAVFLLYIDKIMPEHNLLKEKMKLVIQRLIHELNEMASENT
jgi:ribonuclease P protein component